MATAVVVVHSVLFGGMIPEEIPFFGFALYWGLAMFFPWAGSWWPPVRSGCDFPTS
jgi:hypothetical protein